MVFSILLFQIAKIQLESKEARLISDAVAQKQKEISSVAINKKTGAPLYSMQPQKSSAQLYKEARLNKLPYEALKVTSTPAASGLQTQGSPSFLSKVWMPLVAMAIAAASIEAAVVYAKESSETTTTPPQTKDSSRRQSFSRNSAREAVLHSDTYTPSTARLIQTVVVDIESRKLEIPSAQKGF